VRRCIEFEFGWGRHQVGAYFIAASCSLKWVTKRAGRGNEIRSHLVALAVRGIGGDGGDGWRERIEGRGVRR